MVPMLIITQNTNATACQPPSSQFQLSVHHSGRPPNRHPNHQIAITTRRLLRLALPASSYASLSSTRTLLLRLALPVPPPLSLSLCVCVCVCPLSLSDTMWLVFPSNSLINFLQYKLSNYKIVHTFMNIVQIILFINSIYKISTFSQGGWMVQLASDSSPEHLLSTFLTAKWI